MYRELLITGLLIANLPANAQTKLDDQLRSKQLQLEEMRTQQVAQQKAIDELTLQIMRRDLETYAIPVLQDKGTVIWHPGHALEYDEEHEQARWTAHIVSPDISRGNLARIDTFLPDPLVASGTTVTVDYWNSGYDRGHLVPSADMRWNYEAMHATYYYSNVSPQLPDLNRGSWATLEDWVRRYVFFGQERVFVITGPVLKPGLPKITHENTQNQVSIPAQFFKVVADLDGPEKKAIAFVMTNGLNDKVITSYAASVDEVEKLTGIDLFPALPDEEEARLEASFDIQQWYKEGDPNFGEVEPLKPPFPKGVFNTTQAKHHIGNEVTICGTVVSTRRSTKGNALYLNFDKMYPNQDFYATIWEYNGPNFSYDPELVLKDQEVCVTGKLTSYQNIARISINNETEIRFWEDVR